MIKLVNIATGLALGIALTGAAFIFAKENRAMPKAARKAVAGNVLTLTTKNFDAASGQDKPVLIDFWATWCGPCRTQGPIVEETSALVGNRALVGKVNVDEERELAARYGVRSIPTLVILKGGQEVKRYVGVTDANVLRDALLQAAQ
jgi:thioredoxin 1